MRPWRLDGGGGNGFLGSNCRQTRLLSQERSSPPALAALTLPAPRPFLIGEVRRVQAFFFFVFPGSGRRGFTCRRTETGYKYTRAVIAGHAERKRRGNRRVFVMDAGGAAAGRRAPAGFTARLSGCQVTRAARRRAAPRHTQSFFSARALEAHARRPR